MATKSGFFHLSKAGTRSNYEGDDKLILGQLQYQETKQGIDVDVSYDPDLGFEVNQREPVRNNAQLGDFFLFLTTIANALSNNHNSCRDRVLSWVAENRGKNVKQIVFRRQCTGFCSAVGIAFKSD